MARSLFGIFCGRKALFVRCLHGRITREKFVWSGRAGAEPASQLKASMPFSALFYSVLVNQNLLVPWSQWLSTGCHHLMFQNVGAPIRVDRMTGDCHTWWGRRTGMPSCRCVPRMLSRPFFRRVFAAGCQCSSGRLHPGVGMTLVGERVQEHVQLLGILG